MAKHKLKEASKEAIGLLYNLMHNVDRILSHVGVEYWIIGGTLLGAVRNKGIIPWDDDLDIGIMDADVGKFLRIPFSKFGYSTVETDFGYKIFYSDRPLIEGVEWSFPFLDVFVYKKMQGRYKLAYPYARKEWPKDTWLPEELYPLRRYKFGATSVWGPATNVGYFEKLYGKDWNEVAYRIWEHQEERPASKVKVQLTKSMRRPARPTTIWKNPIVDKFVGKPQRRSRKKSRVYVGK